MTRAPIGPTKPAPGVIATRPETAPDTAPSSEGLRLKAHSPNIQATAAAAVASRVLMKASAATSPASSAEPALKPNQPTHSSEAPIMVMVSECGAIDSRPSPMRLPMTYAPTRPATAALMWTTVPPAKSSAPCCHRKPALLVTVASEAASVIASGPAQNHTMWATGR